MQSARVLRDTRITLQRLQRTSGVLRPPTQWDVGRNSSASITRLGRSLVDEQSPVEATTALDQKILALEAKIIVSKPLWCQSRRMSSCCRPRGGALPDILAQSDRSDSKRPPKQKPRATELKDLETLFALQPPPQPLARSRQRCTSHHWSRRARVFLQRGWSRRVDPEGSQIGTWCRTESRVLW